MGGRRVKGKAAGIDKVGSVEARQEVYRLDCIRSEFGCREDCGKGEKKRLKPRI